MECRVDAKRPFPRMNVTPVHQNTDCRGVKTKSGEADI